jgi:hypothetical protein
MRQTKKINDQFDEFLAENLRLLNKLKEVDPQSKVYQKTHAKYMKNIAKFHVVLERLWQLAYPLWDMTDEEAESLGMR